MKTVAIIPIKLNNERLPNKNIKVFDNGEPLITYVLRTLLRVTEIDEIYVFCSNEKIKDYLPVGVSFLKRDKKFDTSQTKMNGILRNFAIKVEADNYILAHATSPFIKSESISKGIQMIQTGKYDSAFSVEKIQDFLWKNGKAFNYDLKSIPRTQDLELIYAETSGFYIYKRDIIMDFNRRIGFCPFFVQVSSIESIDIDEKEDFDIANAIYNYILKDSEV